MFKCVILETAEPIWAVDHSFDSPCKGAGLEMKEATNPLADAEQGPKIENWPEVLRSQYLAALWHNFGPHIKNYHFATVYYFIMLFVFWAVYFTVPGETGRLFSSIRYNRMSKYVISETAEATETVNHSLESPCKGAGLQMKDVSIPLARS